MDIKADRAVGGLREDMIAEYATNPDVTEKYHLTWFDEAGHQWDTEGYRTKKALLVALREEEANGLEVGLI